MMHAHPFKQPLCNLGAVTPNSLGLEGLTGTYAAVWIAQA